MILAKAKRSPSLGWQVQASSEPGRLTFNIVGEGFISFLPLRSLQGERLGLSVEEAPRNDFPPLPRSGIARQQPHWNETRGFCEYTPAPQGVSAPGLPGANSGFVVWLVGMFFFSFFSVCTFIL